MIATKDHRTFIILLPIPIPISIRVALMLIVTENEPIPFVNLLIFDCIYRTTDVKQLPVPNPTVGISHPPVVYHAKKMPQYKPEYF